MSDAIKRVKKKIGSRLGRVVHTHKFEASLVCMPVPSQSENSKCCLKNKQTKTKQQQKGQGRAVREAGAG